MHRSWLASMRKINGDEFWRGQVFLIDPSGAVTTTSLESDQGTSHFDDQARTADYRASTGVDDIAP